MFEKILIANRGEIACRVIETARRLGVKTVAVYSDADANARHVRMADEAYRIGPAPASESYLKGADIIRVATEAGAQAIHPGYGFLSENAGFARACAEAGLTFIGPKPETIEVMGSKARAKQLMGEAGVPMLPGYQGEEQSLSTFEKEAARIGYPVLLKAAAGGGGKGMRIVRRAEDLSEELESAKREAMSAFGDDRFIVEKFLDAPRHVEMQIFGDHDGRVVHLYERDCSVQRRYQKVIEEAPAPNIPDDTRRELHRAAVDAAKAVGYVGAGTVEFLYDGAEGVHFMEMNTRLQVEHPVTEEVTGVDLVEWQLRVAAGEPIPLSQEDIPCIGHAVEARLYAEDPSENYLPQIGRLLRFALIDGEEGSLFGPVRLDTGVEPGDSITPYYDPMIAKVIAAGDDREEAIMLLADALESAEIDGLVTNRDFLVRILRNEAFVNGPPTTKFLDEEKSVTETDIPPLYLAAAALALAAPGDDLEEALGFRLNRPSRTSMTAAVGKRSVSVAVVGGEGHYALLLDSDRVPFSITKEAGTHRLETDADAVEIDAWWTDGRAVILDTPDGLMRVPLFDVFAASGAADADEAALSAPMPATVTGVKVAVGDHVTKGQVLITLEAMKMETLIKAPADGTVAELHCEAGATVAKGVKLLSLEHEG
ncbi:MAG: biotin carboxylase N-terminal domain-containing protein [Parvularcula sp.]|jgi:3-methylcrotonyl-CoA carboxylase alpha subunit|nr:biotin carboxylase N-terminal domain-containing protein [Parvularcula sp.]